MDLSNEDHWKCELEHARWRVDFFKNIFESHMARASTWKGDDWEEKADLYRRRHGVAAEALQQLESSQLRV